MAREVFPSSYECDCGHRSQFFENTVKEMKKLSMKKQQVLADSEVAEHKIVFYRGQAVKIICPKSSAKHPISADEA
jgi:hypothetical protein